MLESNDNLAKETEDIFIEPPDATVDTDDSANEDEG